MKIEPVMIYGRTTPDSGAPPALAIFSIAAGAQQPPTVGATYVPTTNKVVPYLLELGIFAVVGDGHRCPVWLEIEGLQQPT